MNATSKRKKEHNRSRYSSGCRCKVCTAANSAYQRTVYARKRMPNEVKELQNELAAAREKIADLEKQVERAYQHGHDDGYCEGLGCAEPQPAERSSDPSEPAA